LRSSDRLGLPGILAMHDWAGQDVLPLTHEFLGEMLGVRHSTVSVVTRTLQTAALIQQSRGGITVTDRAGFEEMNATGGSGESNNACYPAPICPLYFAGKRFGRIILIRQLSKMLRALGECHRGNLLPVYHDVKHGLAPLHPIDSRAPEHLSGDTGGSVISGFEIRAGLPNLITDEFVT
jgi:hypothetical protein